MTNIKFILSFFILLLPIIAIADTSDQKKQVNDIKRSSEYIWAVSSGEDENICREIAHEEFLSKLKNYINENEQLKDSQAVILPKVESIIKELSFDKTEGIKLVCLYIKKEDIIPLYGKDTQVNDIVVLSPETKQNTNKEISNRKENRESEKEEIRDINKEEKLESKEEKHSNSKSSNQIKEQNSSLKVSQEQDNVIKSNENFESEKVTSFNNYDSDILQDLKELKTYSECITYLNHRKNENHDVMFRLEKRYNNTNNSYWIILDKSRTVIALLDSTRCYDLITNQPITENIYNNNPQIWVKID